MITINQPNKTLTSLGIFNSVWEPEKTINGGIILVHGLGEYCGRYLSNFGNYFTNKNYKILTFDLPGHGYSTGERGTIPSYEIFLDIISEIVSDFRKTHPNLPLFVYGHSLGGLIALDYVISKKPSINGLICSAPVLDVYEPINPVKKSIAKILKNLSPGFSMKNGLNIDSLSKDKNIVDAYKNDPLVHPMTSALLGMYIIEKGEQIRSNPEELKANSLLMVGSNEKIVSKKAIQDFCSESNACMLHVWEGLFHELHNEPEQLEVFEYVEKWMQKQ